MEYIDFGPVDKHFYVPPPPLSRPLSPIILSMPTSEKGIKAWQVAAFILGAGIIVLVLSEWQKNKNSKDIQETNS